MSSLQHEAHRVCVASQDQFEMGDVRYAPTKSLWFCAMATGAFAGAFFYFTAAGVALFFASTAFVLLFGHSLGSHRKFIHDSFQCPRWLAHFLVYCGTLVGLAGPIALLRQHDLRDIAQRQSTCHPFLRHGGGFWRDAWWQLHCDLCLRIAPEIEIEASRNTSFYRFLERTWMLQQIPPALVLFYVGGIGFVCWGVCARVTASVFGHWLVGYFAHNHGAMNYEVRGAAVQGKNIRWASLFTMGESLHNNHHAFPDSARLGLHSGEWDPGWWTLCAFRHVGLAYDVKTPEDLPSRPELHRSGAAVQNAPANAFP